MIPIVFNLGAAIAAGTNETWALGTFPADIPTAQLINATIQNGATLAANATDFNTFEVRAGSTVMASLNSGAVGFTADTLAAMTLSTTVANRRIAGGTALSFVKTATLNGTAGATTAQAILTLWFRIGSDDLLAT